MILWLGGERIRRWQIAVAVLILALVLIGVVFVLCLKTPKAAQVGIFYYMWYGAPDSDSWNASKFVDFPVVGNYSSTDTTVIRQHLRLIEDMGADFVVFSWWGFQDKYGNFTDKAAKEVFRVAAEENSSLKFAIMVEPYNRSGIYDYEEIYSHVYSDFVAPFESFYYKEDKPLICFFNNESLTPNGVVPCDSRFETVIVGHEPYVQWIYTDLNYNAKPASVSYDNEVSVTPRYDDSRLNRTQNCTVDINLAQGTFNTEWENAIQLWKDGEVNTIMITSWNEYPERTAIEPHYDATAYNQDPYYLYNMTKDYIRQVHLLGK